MTDRPDTADLESPTLLADLESWAGSYDELPFGLIVMDRAGIVVEYNRTEAELSGLDQTRVVGRNFFEEVGPCTNNFLVAQRFVDSEELDETIDYVFTFRMAPTPVRLRMLIAPGADRQYLAVTRR